MIWLWRCLLALPFAVRLALCFLVVSFWCYACVAPPSDEPASFEINDKVAHFVGNFGVAGVIFIAAICRRWWPLALLVGSYSFAIECVQAYLPDRDFSLWDMVANIAGIAAAELTMWWLERRKATPAQWI